MSLRTLNRKQFLAFTASSVAVSVLAACGEDDPGTTGGTSGSGGTTPGVAGSGTSGSVSTSGSGGSSGAGTAGNSTGGSTAGSGGSTAGSGGSAAGSGGSTAGSGGSTAGSGGAGGSGGGMCNADIMTTSSGGHTHTLLVTAAQITAGTEVEILSGGADGDDSEHKHQVKITAADFTALKAGMTVTKKSCSNSDHEYVLKCGGGAGNGAAPDCNADPDCGSAQPGSACD